MLVSCPFPLLTSRWWELEGQPLSERPKRATGVTQSPGDRCPRQVRVRIVKPCEEASHLHGAVHGDNALRPAGVKKRLVPKGSREG